MYRCLVIGIGPGDPELVTVKAIRALNSADLVLVPLKGDKKQELAELRRTICRRYLDNPATRVVEFELPARGTGSGGYLEDVREWHDVIAATYAGLLSRELPAGGSFALLVWGDPSLYDSTLRIVERLRSAHRLAIETGIVPGVTSIQALTAGHAIPLNALGGSVLVTTGRRLRDGIPDGVDTIVVMLDGEASFRLVAPDGYDIYWGAYLGLGHEMLLSGPLSEVANAIASARAEARAGHGWIMDVYILRRRAGS